MTARDRRWAKISTRRERVVLDVEDNLQSALIRDAAAARLLSKELNNLSGQSVRTGRDLDKTSDGSKKVGDSSSKAGPEIDRYSGRLRALADAAIVLGPAAVRLGAGAIPVLTTALVGLGAAAGGIGAAVLAFNGLGDALKAIDEYRLEPTAENLQKVRLEAEKMGPAGMEFARYLANLEPVLQDLQNVAREGIFPGVEDGLDSLLTRGPQVSRIISELATGMGDLARDAGAGLASDRWTPFFDYIESDARPTLEAFGDSIGNLSLGVANLLVAFAPLTRDATGGLQDLTQSFADWSANLDDNESFQEFLDYIRESGPDAVKFLGAIAQAFAGLLQAMAPLGAVTLPVLTGVAKVFAAIASSPIGPTLYAAVTAMVAFNRAAALTEAAGKRLSTSWASMKGGLTSGQGVVLALALALKTITDLKSAYDDLSGSIDQADTALRDNDVNAMLAERADLLDQIAKGHPEDGTISNWWAAGMGSFQDFIGLTDKAKDRIAEIDDAMRQGGDVADLFGESIGQTGDQLRVAANDADAFSGALARLNGWFDKRDAVRGYKDAIDELRKSMKDGFTREDAGNLDAVGRSILQVATNIKNPALRADFLQSARAQLVDMAENAGPKAAAAIQDVIDKFDDKALTHPPDVQIGADDRRARNVIDGVQTDLDIMGKSTVAPTVAGNDNPWQILRRRVDGDLTGLDAFTAVPEVDADTASADRKTKSVRFNLDDLNGTTARPQIDLNVGDSVSLLARLSAMLNGLHDRTISVRVNHLGGGSVTAGGGHSAPEPTEPPARLANPRSTLTPRSTGSARADTAAAFDRTLYGNMRSSGSTGGDAKAALYDQTKAAASGAASGLWHVADAASSAGWHVAALGHDAKDAKEQIKKLRDAAKDAAAAAKERRDSLAQGITQGLGGDIWGGTGSVWAGGFGAGTPQAALANLQEQKARAQRLVAAINTLRAKGVTGPVLAEIIGSGDVERAEAMAAMDLGFLSSFSSEYASTQNYLAAAGLAGGSAVFGDEVNTTQDKLDQIISELQKGNATAESGYHVVAAATTESGWHVVNGVNGAGSKGHKRGRK